MDAKVYKTKQDMIKLKREKRELCNLEDLREGSQKLHTKKPEWNEKDKVVNKCNFFIY